MDTYLVRIQAEGVVRDAAGNVKDDVVGVQELTMTADELRAAGLDHLIEDPEGGN